MNRFVAREAYLRPQPASPSALLSDPSPPPNIVIRTLFVLFFVFDFPAFTLQLAMDKAGEFTGSPVIAAMTLAGELFAAIVILTSRDARGLAKRSWPVLAMIGLGLMSALWSVNPKATLDVTIRVAGTLLLGLAIVGRMPHFQGVRSVIRTMVLGCVLSLAWVFIFPESAVHQTDDAYQTVHAGLWRGIFTHKQGLGYFSGLTTGLLLFYRTSVFSPVVLIGAIACALTCLIGTQSATGFISMVLTPLIFYAGRVVILSPPSARRGKLMMLMVTFLVVGAAFQTGLLNFVITNGLGKSTDLTGRADFWPIAIANLKSSGRSWLGGGLGAGFASDLSEWSIDNGYLDMLIDFGYLTVPILFWLYGVILWKSIKLLLKTPREFAAANVFPFGILMVILIVNITESNFMTKTCSTVLTAVAAGLVFERRNHVPDTVLRYADFQIGRDNELITKSRPTIT